MTDEPRDAAERAADDSAMTKLQREAIRTSPMPDAGERGTVASADDSDPAPERDRPAPPPTGEERGGSGDAVGNDNIREGRVGGVMGPRHGQHGQGEG